VEKARKGIDDAVANEYQADKNELLLKLEYQINNKIVCMFDDKIKYIQNGNMQELLDFDSEIEKISFVDIKIADGIVKVAEMTDDSESSSKLEFQSTAVDTTNYNNLTGIVEELYTSNSERIAINFGTEIKVYNLNGWLIKDYTTTEEIRDVVMNDSFAGIVYKDRVEILKY